ncbi:dCTP deaminase [Candidatus Gottesmanbacteria bacterium RIFCSPHIGHO2_02_FULL_39_11]|uniref:dCTP deaminase n=1 Tax=Candidatus Gottesmanbacteria bacterium RIFCSPHIGHO2_02_FULL_39_11 TaxID=1798382 RepID=A0A1F5ZN32_9BACT|nr:MAG: dCTP deaminase [Candidatus Gottesmanbacteria bacterium RIFCSPHIGHO2_02_FULL_39_11]
MVLSDRDIKKAIKSKRIIIKPLPDFSTQLGSCTLDLRLGNVYRVFNHSRTPFLDPRNPETIPNITSEITINDTESFTLHPGEFILAITKEYIEMPDDLTGRLEGRSSIGRMGVVIHSTAANIECGFRGQITLELANMGPIPVILYPGIRICSLSFEQLSSPAEVPYYKKKGAKYVNQKSPLESRLGEEK